MTANEANKIIAEYMGMRVGIFWKFLGCSLRWGAFYTESLDTLVPVWEKLDMNETHFYQESATLYHDDFPDGVDGKGKTLQEAAAIATANLIQELQQLGENNG